MDILVVMCAGALAGRLAVPVRARRLLELGQTACTALLILSMGASLGSMPGFVRNIGRLGLQSLVFCVAAMAFSVGFVYVLTERLMPGARTGAGAAADGGAGEDVEVPGSGAGDRVASGTGERRPSEQPWRLDGMALLALMALVLGVCLGLLGTAAGGGALRAAELLAAASDPALYLLMFLVGISVGVHRGLFASVREHHVKTLCIPAGVVAGSLAGGALASVLLGFGLREGMAVAGGMGWYSLAGVQVEALAGAQLGGIAFLANLMRELLSFFSIPFIARRLNYYSCIAAAASTSEDTTLPMMIRYTDERTVVFSVVNGVICSAVVPVLISALLG